MKIIDYFESDKKEYWLTFIAKSDWRAAQFLVTIINENRINELLGNTKILLLIDEDELISFCTLADKDDIKTELSPWIGFVYTFPKYRGHRYMGLLINEALNIAKNRGDKTVYISTNEIGLYEKYGFEFYGILKDIDAQDSRVYKKDL